MTRADERWCKKIASYAAYLEGKQLSLFDAIVHGDERHQAWLKQAIFDHFADRPVTRWE